MNILPKEQQSTSQCISTPVHPETHRPLVMVVGENEDTRCMLRVILELWDYEVIEACTIEESLSLSRGRKPAVILIDSTLQFNNSLDDVSKLRHSENLGDTPSLVISGFSQDLYRESAIESGASGFLVKPVDFDLLRHHVATLITQAQGH